MLLGPRDFFLSKETIIYKQVCYQVPGISSCPKRQLYINRYAIRSQGFLLVQTIIKQVCYQVPGRSKETIIYKCMLLGPRDFFLSKEAIIYKQVCYQVPGISSCPNKETIIYKQVCYQVPGISSCPKRQLYINRYAIRSQGFLLVQLYINRYAIRSQGFLLVQRGNYI